MGTMTKHFPIIKLQNNSGLLLFPMPAVQSGFWGLPEASFSCACCALGSSALTPAAHLAVLCLFWVAEGWLSFFSPGPLQNSSTPDQEGEMTTLVVIAPSQPIRES